MVTSPPLDLLVLGSGVAGLSAAVRAVDAHGMRVGVVTKGALAQATTRWAQGGVAAVLREDPDSTDLHLADTLAAGAGLCDADAVRILVDEGPRRVHGLIALGAMFDRDEHGVLELAREGGHSMARVVHAGGAATGAEIERALVDAVRATAAVVSESGFARDLIVERGRCRGVVVSTPSGPAELRADHVLLATGGAGQMFSVTTNPVEVTGDGVAMALRAGVAVADVELVQFHPTALHHPQMPRPLLSEALRGHGALLRDARGERFVDELLPRDEVARAETRRMLELGVDHCWLDATGLEHFDQRFPTISAALASVGLDPAADWLPIAPAAHFLCGGVVTDLDGATSLPGLWAAGEVACSGVHGANRLASNSLLEGMVFGFRAVEAIDRGVTGPRPTGAMRAVTPPAGPGDGPVIGGSPVTGWSPYRWGREAGGGGPFDAVAARGRLQRAMTRGAGVLRSQGSLDETRAVVEAVAAAADGAVTGPAAERGGTAGPGGQVAGRDVEPGGPADELRNLVEVARALLAAATQRTESRGAHTRTDHPARDDAHFRARLVLRS